MEDCLSYGDCQLPSWECDGWCKYFNKSCWDCGERIGEECGIHGHEVFPDSIPCKEFCLED